MGRARPPIPRSRPPLHRRVRSDPSALRSWLLVAAGSVLVASGVSRALARADAAQRQWGERVPVVVATDPIREGETVAGRVAVERWPRALVPAGALRRVPGRARASAPLGRGLPITSGALERTDHQVGGRVLVPIPAPEASVPLRPGQRVDVWATSDPSLAEGRLTTARVTERARVERADTRVVVVAVPPATVDDLVEAIATATLTIVRVG